MSDTTSFDEAGDPTGTQHLGTDSDPLAAGPAVPSDTGPSAGPGNLDGGRPEGDPGALTDDEAASDVATGTPETVVPPTGTSGRTPRS